MNCVNFFCRFCVYLLIMYSSQFSFTTCWYEWLRKMVLSRQSAFGIYILFNMHFYFVYVVLFVSPLRAIPLCLPTVLCPVSTQLTSDAVRERQWLLLLFILLTECSSWCVLNARQTFYLNVERWSQLHFDDFFALCRTFEPPTVISRANTHTEVAVVQPTLMRMRTLIIAL